ncbi:hypothetical protein KUL156_27750 [Alteromonas sp. KUL156]|nr:hypothetical protein KUL154_49370 [Alteromonas sp. KUL154]GFE00183.1 hypothetical protein KUL156_27750 [Alteromonas sp. KUL156]
MISLEARGSHPPSMEDRAKAAITKLALDAISFPTHNPRNSLPKNKTPNPIGKVIINKIKLNL